MMDDLTPRETESAPRLAPTTPLYSSLSGTGIEPEFREIARSVASAGVKSPVISPRPVIRWLMFGAETTRMQIAWSVGFLASNMGVAMMKMWFWMQMDKNTVIREVKRLELQVATLAGIIKNQT